MLTTNELEYYAELNDDGATFGNEFQAAFFQSQITNQPTRVPFHALDKLAKSGLWIVVEYSARFCPATDAILPGTNQSIIFLSGSADAIDEYIENYYSEYYDNGSLKIYAPYSIYGGLA